MLRCAQPPRYQRKTSRPWFRFGVPLAAALLFGTACAEEPIEPSAAEVLAIIEGRELTPAEVAERQEVAQLLCGMDDQVLTLMWADMSPSQLEFQDWVFGQVCRERSDAYATATGRFSSSGTGSTTTAPATTTSSLAESTTTTSA